MFVLFAVQLLKMYFVAVADPSDISYQADFSEVYSFDGKYDRMAKHKIKTLGEDIKEPVMRIRWDKDSACVGWQIHLPGYEPSQ